MDPFIIFKCLKDKKSLRTFIFSVVILAIVYFAFSIIISLLSIKPLPQGTLIEIILFGMLRAFSTFRILDWIVLVLFPLIGCGSTTCWFELRPTTAAMGVSNPIYVGHLIGESYNPASGSIGDLAIATITFQGTDTLSRKES